MKTHIKTEAETGNKAVREFSYTVANKRMNSIKHGGKTEKGDYELGIGEIELTLTVIAMNIEQNKTLAKHIIQLADTLCGGKIPAHLVKRIVDMAGLKPGDTLTGEHGTAAI